MTVQDIPVIGVADPSSFRRDKRPKSTPHLLPTADPSPSPMQATGQTSRRRVAEQTAYGHREQTHRGGEGEAFLHTNSWTVTLWELCLCNTVRQPEKSIPGNFCKICFVTTADTHSSKSKVKRKNKSYHQNDIFCRSDTLSLKVFFPLLFSLTATFKPPISMTTVFSFEAFPDFTPVMSPPRIHTHAFTACRLTTALPFSCLLVSTSAVSL